MLFHPSLQGSMMDKSVEKRWQNSVYAEVNTIKLFHISSMISISSLMYIPGCVQIAIYFCFLKTSSISSAGRLYKQEKYDNTSSLR